MLNSNILSVLDAEKIEYLPDFDLKNLSTFKVGGRCAVAIFPKSEKELVSTLSALDFNGDRAEVIGKGSNILFADGELDMALIFTGKINSFDIDKNIVHASCGVSITALSHSCAESGLCGLEFACGIPGSIGGSVFMNAGAYGGAVSDVITSSLAYDRDKAEIRQIKEHGFSYRDSIYMQNEHLICLGAEFVLEEGDPVKIKKKNSELLEKRRNSQPLSYPSAGSYFKRPEGYFAGKLIEDCGLKGRRVGDAQISQKHAGFIINLGAATFDDIMRLEDIVKETVFKNFGVELCREVKVIR